MNIINVSKLKYIANWLIIAGLITSLGACGGGGGGSTSSTSSQMTLSGTAATGKALDGAAISISCVTGSGTAVANAGGGFSVTITDAKGPCLLTATKGSTVLHSVSAGGGPVNITPLTEMLVNFLASRAGTTIDLLLSNVTGRAVIGDSVALNNAQTALIALIFTKYGVTIAPNFLTVIITTPQGGTQSQSDKDLDILKAIALIGPDGNLVAIVIILVKSEGQKSPYVPPTGATGATSGANS